MREDNHDGRGWVRKRPAPVCALLAGLLALLVQALGAQPAPNVVAWGSWSGVQMTPPDDATNVVMVADAVADAVALRADGTVLAWGLDNEGQADVPQGLTNVVAVWANGVSLALRGDGSVAAWGYNGAGQTNVPATLTNAVALAASLGGLALALRSDHTVAHWGSVGNLAASFLAHLTNAVAVAAGFNCMFALRADGTVAVGWVYLDDVKANPTNVPPDLTNAVAISAGDFFAMALQADGTVVVWGENLYGETNVPPGLTNVVAIAAGECHCLALRADGTVVAWGLDYDGQADVPDGLTNVVSISAGAYSSMAVIGPALPPSQVALTNLSLGPAGFTVQVPTDRGRVYELGYKRSLTDAHWQLLPLVAGTGGFVQLSDPTPSAAQRFYRVRRW